MRIAQVATLARPVPPKGEGSVELLVDLITEELVRRGHDVTLFAAEGSSTSARLLTPSGESYSTDRNKWNWELYEGWQVQEAFRRWEEFDLIHCHSYHHGLMYCDWVPIPSLHTFHTEPGPDVHFLAKRTRNRHFHFASRFQARGFPDTNSMSVIPHGLHPRLVQHIPLPQSRGDYLAYLGRLTEDKGVDEAVALAESTGLRLLIAGPASDYFQAEVARRVKGRIEYVGELRGTDVTDFLSRAACLLYPLKRPEPFGLVLIEAGLCGTPVVASDLGAVPEIIQHGITGWLARSRQDFLAGIEAAAAMDRAAIQQRTLQRYSPARMVDDLEQLMTRLIEERRNAP